MKLVGFGTFTKAKRKARAGRNPQTGKAIKIPASNFPKFRAGAELKKLVKLRELDILKHIHKASFKLNLKMRKMHKVVLMYLTKRNFMVDN